MWHRRGIGSGLGCFRIFLILTTCEACRAGDLQRSALRTNYREHKNPQQGEERKTQRCNRYFAHGLPPCLGCRNGMKAVRDSTPTGGNTDAVVELYSVSVAVAVHVTGMNRTVINRPPTFPADAIL